MYQSIEVFYITNYQFKNYLMSKKYMLVAESLVASNSKVNQVLNSQSVFLSILVCIVALGIIFLSSWMEDKSSTSYMAGNTLAVILLAFGFYRLLNKRNQLIYVPTKSVMLSGSFYLETQQLESFKEALKGGTETDFSNFKFIKSGNIRLDYFVARDGNFIATQLYQYIPYNFEAVTDIICHEEDKAHSLAMFILKNHGKI